MLRFHANGTRDLSFGTGGVVRTDFQAFDASENPGNRAADLGNTGRCEPCRGGCQGGEKKT